jgi:hypothetical protein
MKSVAEHLISIRDFLADKERWETNYINNRASGYSSGSLSNGLAGIWCASDKKSYPPAYRCVAQAIDDLFGERVRNTYAYRQYTSHLQPLDEYQAEPEDIRLVWSFDYFPSHDNLMEVMSLAIRYANLLVFS